MSEEKKELLIKEDIDQTKFATKSSPIAIILCTFFGFLGAHRFYTGYFFIGLFQLLTCGGFLIWFLIDMIQLFRNKYEDSKGNPLMNYNENNKLASGLCCFATILAICWGYLYLKQIDNLLIKIKNPSQNSPIGMIKGINERDLTKEITQETETANNKAITNVSKQGISISRHNPCVDSKGNNMVCGTIINNTQKPAKNITIKIELYDKDENFVAFSESRIYQLKAQEEFDFQAPIFYNTVTDYKIIKISSN